MIANPERAISGGYTINADVYNHSPEELAALAVRSSCASKTDSERFNSFTRRVHHVRTTARCSRTAGEKAWWKIRSTRDIKNGNNMVIGQLMKFVYVVRPWAGDRDGLETKWLMSEYRATLPDNSHKGCAHLAFKNSKKKLSDWALCKIYESTWGEEIPRKLLVGSPAETLTQQVSDDGTSSRMFGTALQRSKCASTIKNTIGNNVPSSPSFNGHGGLDPPLVPEDILIFLHGGGFTGFQIRYIPTALGQEPTATPALWGFPSAGGQEHLCVADGECNSSLPFDASVHHQQEHGITSFRCSTRIIKHSTTEEGDSEARFGFGNLRDVSSGTVLQTKQGETPTALATANELSAGVTHAAAVKESLQAPIYDSSPHSASHTNSMSARFLPMQPSSPNSVLCKDATFTDMVAPRLHF